MSDARSTPRRRIVHFTDEDLIALTVLYEKGLKDPEIAEEMGVHRAAVKYQRHKIGLLRSRLFTDQELVELHKLGLNDREIAEKLGASKGVVFYHRKRLKLKANRHRTLDRTFTDSQLIELHKRGLNDREIASELGVSWHSSRYHRKKLRLESNYKLKLRARAWTPTIRV